MYYSSGTNNDFILTTIHKKWSLMKPYYHIFVVCKFGMNLYENFVQKNVLKNSRSQMVNIIKTFIIYTFYIFLRFFPQKNLRVFFRDFLVAADQLPNPENQITIVVALSSLRMNGLTRAYNLSRRPLHKPKK